MGQVLQDDAIARARSVMGVDAHVPARAWIVERLDREGQSYYLVVFGKADAALGAVTVDARTGEVMASAHMAGSQTHLPVDSDSAVRLANLGADVKAQLVWQPCTASFSPLYPIWRISGVTGSVFVDQGGKRWSTLGEGRG